MKRPDIRSLTLIGLGFLLPAIAARVAQSITGRGYKLITHREAPKNPVNPEVPWKDALAWAALTGVIGGVARLTARRWLAETAIPTEGDDMDEKLDEIA